MSRSAPALADVPGLDRFDRTARRVVALVLAALALRLVVLGARVSHYDEARVAWWSLNYLQTGEFEYRYIIHGPFVQHVNKYVFWVVGANDFTARLIVAVIGALLPLSALLFRDRLDGDEVVAAAFFLAFNPILLYYSRFFRSSLLVAAFSFVAFGFLVRAYDRRSFRQLHAAALFLALAFAAKENAAVYILCWLGGTALIVDHVFFRTGDEESGVDWLYARLATHRDRLDHYRAHLGRYVGHLVLAGVIFFMVSLFFYAPRTPNSSAVGFWDGIVNPLRFPDLVGATKEDVITGYEYWFGGSTDAGGRHDGIIDEYTFFFERAFNALKKYALALMVLSLFGFLLERYGRAKPRNLVLFAGYWGFVSVLGYPLGTDIASAWITVNALVPLAIPAGVGLAYVTRGAIDAFEAADPVRLTMALFVLVLVGGQMTYGMADGVYLNPTSDENELVQYAQPADDFRPALRSIKDRQAHNSTDVLIVGSPYARDSPRHGGMEPRCLNIGKALPLHWYLEIYDAETACEPDATAALRNMSGHDPLVVVTSDRLRSQFEEDLHGYEARSHRLRAWGRETVYFVRQPSANASTGASAGASG